MRLVHTQRFPIWKSQCLSKKFTRMPMATGVVLKIYFTEQLLNRNNVVMIEISGKRRLFSFLKER